MHLPVNELTNECLSIIAHASYTFGSLVKDSLMIIIYVSIVPVWGTSRFGGFWIILRHFRLSIFRVVPLLVPHGTSFVMADSQKGNYNIFYCMELERKRLKVVEPSSRAWKCISIT